MYHSLLDRQLKKLSLTVDDAPALPEWEKFLEKVDRTYRGYERDRKLFEHSLQISSDEMHRVNEQLRISEKRYALAAEASNDGLWDWDFTSGKIYYSRRWLEILGVTCLNGEEFTREMWLDQIHPDDAASVISELGAHLRSATQRFENEHRVRHSGGDFRWVRTHGIAVRNTAGAVVRLVGSLSDISDQKTAEARLEYDALHDTLTGLPNRKYLETQLISLVSRKRKHPEFEFGALFIDLDRFKTVNDSMGHQAGDELLSIITAKLKLVLRPRDMVFRFGGDEFVVVVEDVGDTDRLLEIGERIQEEFQKPVQIQGKTIYSSASIGIVVGDAETLDPDELIRDADVAMYRAKTKGKARCEIFEKQMHQGAVSLLQLEIDLRRAIDEKEFSLHYQPIVSISDNRLIGFEALIRWNHPERGLVSPLDFVPFAEESGLILPIGRWVIFEACAKLRFWQEQFPAAYSLLMSVNLSARQLENPHLLEEIAEILRVTRLNPMSLKLEITEGVIMNNAEQSVDTVKRLRGMGVRVSIDDFGTGYSSLSYLQQLPIDTLKVDRSFVSRIGGHAENSEIVRAIVTLAKNLGMDVIAEGIETQEQRDVLQMLDCQYGQGYLYSRPVDEKLAANMVRGLQDSGTELFKIPLTNLQPESSFAN